MGELERWAHLLQLGAAEQAGQPSRICVLCTQLLGVSGAGITMVTATGNRGVVCSTDDRAGQIEELQVTSGVGPCIDAVDSGAPVLLPDLDAATEFDIARWPTVAADVRRSGVRALFAFPLRIGAIVLGALDLYRDRPGVLVAEQLSMALLAADAAALSLLHLNTDDAEIFTANPETGANSIRSE